MLGLAVHPFFTPTIIGIDTKIHRAVKRLEREQALPTTDQRQQITVMLQDNLAAHHERKVGFEQTRDSCEVVQADQQHLENNVCSPAEMEMSRSYALNSG